MMPKYIEMFQTLFKLYEPFPQTSSVDAFPQKKDKSLTMKKLNDNRFWYSKLPVLVNKEIIKRSIHGSVTLDLA